MSEQIHLEGETFNTIRLAQKVSYNIKSANDFLYMKKTMDYYINSLVIHSEEDEERDRLARVRSGALNTDDYSYVINGFNFKKAAHKLFPAKIRNYPLVAPVCELFLGEYYQRPRTETVVATNSDVDNQIKQSINLQIEQAVQQIFIKTVESTDVVKEQGEPVDAKAEQEKLNQLMANISTNVDDKLAILGQDVLDYLYYMLDLTDKYQYLLDDYLTFGQAVTYKTIKRDDVVHEYVPAREIHTPIVTGVSFLEDYDVTVRKKLTTLGQIIDEYYDEGLADKLGDLEGIAINEGGIDYTGSSYRRLFTKTGESSSIEEKLPTYDFEVYHVIFPSYKKIGILNRLNELGELTVEEVEEDYKLDESIGDVSIEWIWIKELWEGTRIGTYTYLNIRPIPVQGTELANRSRTINPYGGIIVRDKIGHLTSLVKTGLPYQTLWNIYHYQHEMIMNKNKDKFMLFPIGLIPKKAGWDEEKFMYTALAGSFMFYDESAPNAAAQLQGIKAIDMSLSKYAADMYELLQLIKNEFWEAVGVNRQRFGDTKASDGKAVTEQAIFRSALTSEETFRKFDKFKEKEANVLINYAKIAWINGKKGNYVLSDGSVNTLNVLGPELALADLGVFAKNSSAEYEKLQKFQNLGLTLLQNSVTVGLLADMLDANNFSKIKQIAHKAEKVIREAEERKILEENNKISLGQYVADRQYDAAIDSALIKANTDNTKEEKTDDNLAKEKFSHDKNMDKEELAFAKKQHQDKMQIEIKKIK